MLCTSLTQTGRRPVMRALAIVSLAAAVAGCNTVARDTTAFVPTDYRQRHPITVKEGKRSIELFVGSGRGGLTPTQRAEVLAFAQNWKRDATGGLVIRRPIKTSNERAAFDTMRQVVSILVAAGIPQRGITVVPYEPNPGKLGTLTIGYPEMMAQAGPCGLWPEDLGASYDPQTFENRPYWNLGCATQRNFAAMVEDPHDLVQPRAETAAYASKRNFGYEKWRKGESPATMYPDAQKGAISELGK